MEIYCGDMWDFAKDGNWIAVTINKVVKDNGRLVMGAGVADQARKRYRNPDIDLIFGKEIRRGVEVPFMTYPDARIYGIPTKNHYKDRTSIQLLNEGAAHLERIIDESLFAENKPKVVCPLLGAGAGGLSPTLVFGLMRSRFKHTDLIIPLTRKDYERIFTGQYVEGKTLRFT